MKALFGMVAALFFAATLFAADPLTLKVEGMTCGSCESSIENAVKKLPGVKTCHADHKTGKVTVEMSDETKVDRVAIEKAISKSGEFKVKE